MIDAKTARKIQLVFEQDENGRLDLSTTEGSMKEAKEGMFPHHADHVLDMAALSMITMETSGAYVLHTHQRQSLQREGVSRLCRWQVDPRLCIARDAGCAGRHGWRPHFSCDDRTSIFAG